jgi:transcriptional regulator with XRE-family HTH domain
MRKVDSVAFGARVRERREELGLSQERLGEEVGYSQSNINWIEGGGPKRPQRHAAELAEALRTTREWLLWKEGSRSKGPQYLTPAAVAEKYEALPPSEKERISKAIEDAGLRRQKTG